MSLSPFHALYTARELTAYRNSTDRLTTAYASSDIEVYPYQIAAATFALRSPYLKGVILADEGSLGKTYEALLVISQMWFEGKERILLVVPTPLLRQWTDIMNNCFFVPYTVIDSNERFNEIGTENLCGRDNPFESETIVLTTYDFAIQKAEYISRINWDAVVFEEAHRLSNYESKTVKTFKEIIGDAFKILLTATPMQNSIMDLYGLIRFIDDSLLGDSDEFYKRYFRKPENYHELTSRVSRYVFRTLRSQVESYIKIPNRLPVTVDYKPTAHELRLSERLEEYLKKPIKTAFPKMDLWELSLMMWRSLSSSTFAFDKLLQGAIERENEPELVEMQKLIKTIEISTKGQELLKSLKKSFISLKKCGANRKALIFTENRATQQYLKKLLKEDGYSILTYNGDKSRDYSIIKQFENKADILISTDIAAEGFNLAFCSFIINYDLPYNVLTLEQRIMRCHRQGQQSDVVVLNFLSKNSLSDTRMLELINKRVLQFDGIMGMSDEIIGDFYDNAIDGIDAVFEKARNKKDIEAEFQAVLTQNEMQNTTVVNKAENVLFTTFTRDIAKKIIVTPQYIKDRTVEINANLWELTKWFFYGKQGYDCIDETRTLKIGIQPQKVFTGKALRRREYSIDDKTLPKSGRHTVYGILAKNIFHEIFWKGIPDSGSVTIADLDEPCTIGYYRIKVKPDNSFFGVYYNVFVGRATNGSILTDTGCRRIMEMPVMTFTEKGDTYGERDGINKTKPHNEVDELINVDEFLNRAVYDTEDGLQEEIESIKLRAVSQKHRLERSLSELRLQIKSAKTELSAQSGDRLKELTIGKQLKLIEKELRSREQGLFLEQMRVDVQAEEKIIKLTEHVGLTVEVKREFIIKVEG